MILPVEIVVTFFTASLVLALVPGPDNIFVLTQSALLAGAIGEWLNTSRKAQLVLNKVAGAVFVGLALKLMTTQR